MSMNDYSGERRFDSGRIPIPEGMDEERTFAQAVELAYDIKRELAGMISGVLADYLKTVQAEAQAAMTEMALTDPQDSKALFMCQRRIAPYAHLMGWIRDKVDEGDAAFADRSVTRGYEEEN